MPKLKQLLKYKEDFIKDLKDPSTNFQIPEYIIIKDKGNKSMGKPRKQRKYTLDQIGDALFAFIEITNKRFDRLEARIDKIETRINNIEKRLDYNNLKKLPTNQ